MMEIPYSVILLGYNSDIIPNINYKSVASSQNLLKGVKISDTLKPSDMIVFLYNLLDAEPLVIDSFSDAGTTYSRSSKQTLISMHRDIYVCEGIVVANEYTSIYSSNGAGENSISIGDYTFELGCEYDESLLGCNVTAYVKDDGEKTPYIKYIFEQVKQNKKLVIWDEDILSVNSSYTIVEYEDERGRADKIKLAKHPKVIINGVFYGDYVKTDLMPKNGYVEFIDNNNDGKYEIVNVKSYQTVIVNSVDVSKHIIQNKFDFTEAHRKPLNLNNVEYSIKKDGQKIKLSDIAIGDVLSVAMSKGTSNRVCEILVGTGRDSFTISRINWSERKLYSDNNTYSLSENYIEYLNGTGKEIKVGEIYEFLLDAFGRVAYSKKMSEDACVLFFRARLDMDTDEIYLKFLDIDGEWKESKLAKRVTLGQTTQTPDKLYDDLRAMNPQMIQLKINADGDVKIIKTAKEMPLSQAKHTEGEFTKTPELTYIYRPISRTFENMLYLANSARLFVMPDSEKDKYNMEAYYVIDASSYFVETSFKVCAYNVDRYGYGEIFTIKGKNETSRMSDDLFVVTGVTQVTDSYGDPCERLEGCGNGYKDISFLTSKLGVLDGIKKGDVINFMLDNTGRVNTKPRTLARLQDDFTKQNDSGTDYYQFRSMRATIAEIDFENGRIIFDYGTDEVTFPFSSSINCMEYDTTTQECDLINYDSFKKNDKVMVITKHYGIRDMIRICD